MPFNEEIFQNGQFKRLKSNTMSRKFYGKDKSQRLLTQCSYKSKLPKAPVIQVRGMKSTYQQMMVSICPLLYEQQLLSRAAFLSFISTSISSHLLELLHLALLFLVMQLKMCTLFLVNLRTALRKRWEVELQNWCQEDMVPFLALS